MPAKAAKPKMLKCSISSIEKEGNFLLIKLKPPAGRKLSFKAGQFVKVHFCLKSDRFEAISFFSSPEDKDILFLVNTAGPVKEEFTTKKKGDVVCVEGPFGDFHISQRPADSVLLCKGMGIAPIHSIAKTILSNTRKEVYILYENLVRNDIAGEKALAELAKNKSAHILFTLLNEQPMDWKGKTGMIDKQMIREVVDSPKTKEYYVCGPSAFVNRILVTLSEMGIPQKSIRSEPWG
ncbi:MAG: FAD-dependent oxidoreductase [Candidatus Bilamarchaeaceae archaeon]